MKETGLQGGSLTAPTPGTGSGAPPGNQSRSSELAFEEYKIVQSKIDNIGDFSQRVRGWSLTVTAGIIAAAATKELPSWFALAAIFTAVFFQMSDRYQRRLQGILIKRALRLERHFHRLDPVGMGSHGERFPYLANSIREDSVQESRFKFVWPFRQGLAGTGRWIRHDYRWLVWRSEYFFYWGQCAFAVVACIVLSVGKPGPAPYQADLSALLRGVTNTPIWGARAQTNVVFVQASPGVTNSIAISGLPSGLATVVLPSTTTNFVFGLGPPGTNYISVLVPTPMTNFVFPGGALAAPTLKLGQTN